MEEEDNGKSRIVAKCIKLSAIGEEIDEGVVSCEEENKGTTRRA